MPRFLIGFETNLTEVENLKERLRRAHIRFAQLEREVQARPKTPIVLSGRKEAQLPHFLYK